MKKTITLAFTGIFLAVSVSALAYTMYDDNGTEFGGACDDGSAFSDLVDSDLTITHKFFWTT